jgi:hypothetical protein
MAGSSRTSFSKRQKERARQEKQAEKAARKAQRKQEGGLPSETPSENPAELTITHDEDGQPVGFDFHDFNS